MFVMASRSFEWTFTQKPLRKYELPEGQDAPVERPLSVANVLLDALDLFFNQRGIGWSWSSHPFPRGSIPPPSIPSILAKTTVIFAVLDSSQYISHLMSPYIDKTGGGSPFDASPHSLPRTVSFLFATYVRAVWVYAQLELMYHVAMLIGRILLRQPASHWPPLFRQPWVATSIGEFWSVHWHQFFRHFVIVFGARPGGALLGRPGALIGAFAVSSLIHIVGLWGTGSGMDMCYDAAFYLVMGVGVFLESVFERATGLPVCAQFGWLWTMAWTLSWGSLLLDLRARCGIFAVEFLPDHLRPGKMLINSIISLFSKCK
jgi:Membrane bound O-acyl transferase family